MEDTAVKVLVLGNKNTEMLLSLEKENASRPSMWGLPGGRSESFDPTIYDTGFRETKEETGVSVVFCPDTSPVWEQFDSYKKAFVLAYYIGGEVIGETDEIVRSAWVPINVLYDEQARKDYCPEGIYFSHIRAARALLRRLRDRASDAYEGKGGGLEPTQNATPKLQVRTLDRGMGEKRSLRPMTGEEVREAARRKRPVYYRYRAYGKLELYKGNVTMNNMGEYGFAGQCRQETLKIFEGRVKPEDFLCEEVAGRN